MGLIDKLKNSIDTMSMGEKLLAGLQVTAIGLVIVFLALVILYFGIQLMSKVLGNADKKSAEKKTTVAPAPVVKEEVVEEEVVDDGELVAVIAAAVAASLHTSTHNIVVRSIVRVGDDTPAWAKAARMN